MILFDDVIQVFALAQQDIDASVSLDTFEAALLAPLLSMVIFSGKPCRLIFSPELNATSRLASFAAATMKSPVCR